MSVPGSDGQRWPTCGRLTWQRAVLWALVLALATAVTAFDPADWPYTVGDEGVYSMQAQSLAFDFDFRYEESDYRRYQRTTGKVPDPLILQSVDGGETLVYSKPVFYSLFLAPFVRFAPERGPIVANLVLLIVAALLLECLLLRRVGADGPLVAALLLFFSVTFGHVFWVHADLFYLVVTALGLCCLDPWLEGRTLPLARLVAGGVLLATAGAGRPFYLAVLAGVLLAAGPTLRHAWGRRAAAIVLAAALVLLLGSAAFHRASGGDWSPYVGERQGFGSATGYPDIDFDRERWPELLAAYGGASWARGGFLLPSFELEMLGHNIVYALLGRSVGIVPYFLPIVLACACIRSGSRRKWLLAGMAVGLIAFLIKSPYNFYGGAGAIANRWFLPLYPVCWFLIERPPSRRWLVASSLAATMFVAPLWFSAASFPLEIEVDNGARRLRYVSPVAKRLLPIETTQVQLSSATGEVQHGDLRVRLLGNGVWSHGQDGLRYRPTADGELLIGSPAPLAGLTVELVPPPGVEAEVVRLVVKRPRRIARHRYWYREIPLHYYRLELPPIADGVERDVLLEPAFRWE